MPQPVGRPKKSFEDRKFNITGQVNVDLYNRLIERTQQLHCSISSIVAEGVLAVLNGATPVSEAGAAAYRGILFGKILAAVLPPETTDEEADQVLAGVAEAPSQLVPYLRKVPADRLELVKKLPEDSLSSVLTSAENAAMNLAYIQARVATAEE